MPIEIDPTESDELRDRGMEFPRLSTDVQTMVREMLENPHLSRIIIHDGETNQITLWGTAGRWAGQTAERLVNNGFTFDVWQRNTSCIEFGAHREDNEH